jgi:uncharacterized protein
MSITLSHYQAKTLQKAYQAGQTTVAVSLDLGLSTAEVQLDGEGVIFADEQRLSWAQVQEIRESENGCFRVEGSMSEKIQVFSEVTNRLCTLMPTERAPALLIAGFPMHRINGITPDYGAMSMIKAAKPSGRVLDTNTGLGYTAIQASKLADSVTTIDIDPAAIEVARQNPWSRDLFDNPKIIQIIGDSYDVVEAFEDESFDCIIHDPPTVTLAGHLYSGDFYAELHRILKKRGRLFHYIGDPSSKLGSRTTKGVIRRLQEVGFRRVELAPQAFGVVAMI